MKEENPGPNEIQGDNSREIIICEGWIVSSVIWLIVLVVVNVKMCFKPKKHGDDDKKKRDVLHNKNCSMECVLLSRCGVLAGIKEIGFTF